ncbi:sulfite exporter TauE/SafE family protein [Nostocoides vanveenii]|uniref:Probable membrane transporter protein n=1 Tax=Nostocoides vanveenii TaxID=330835 RepID=A0ABP4W4Y4_9MICO
MVSILDALAIIAAGVGAGTINAIVGSGSLITFPTLLLLGFPPVTANISNNVGMVAGGLSATFGYRRELAGHGRGLARLVPVSLVGSAAGALLLLVLPSEAFAAIVPVLILLGLLLVVFGPRIQAWARSRHDAAEARDAVSSVVSSNTGVLVGPRSQRLALLAGILLAGTYGGYFGAAQGVILMGLLSTLAHGSLQTLNGYKNVLATTANLIAAIVFLIAAPEHIEWWVVLYIALGTFTGGLIGAGVGRRLPAPVLRGIIIAVGIVGIVKIVFFP